MSASLTTVEKAAAAQQLGQAIAHAKGAVRSLETARHMAKGLPEHPVINRVVYDVRVVLQRLEEARMLVVDA